MLNLRSKKILYYLSQQNNTISVKKLASKFNVSERSIRNDIREINDWLNEVDLSPLEHIKRKGVRISTDAKDILLKLNINSRAYVFSAQERRWIILGRLLFENEILNISKLPDLLNVSPSTVVTDMRYVYLWMKENNIKIYSKPHIGAYLGGCELEIRRGCVLLLNEIACPSFERMLLSNFKELTTILEHYISKEIASSFEKNRSCVLTYIKETQKKHHYHLTDDGLWTVFLQFMVTLHSIKNRHGSEQLSKITTFYDCCFAPNTTLDFTDLLEMCSFQEEIVAENKYLNVVWHSGNRMANHESNSIFTKNEIHTFLHRLEVNLGYYIPWGRNEMLNTSKNLDVFLNKHILGLRFSYEDEIEYSIEKREKEFSICRDVLREFLADKSKKENYNPSRYETVQILVDVISSLANSEFETMSNKHDIVVVCSGVISESSLIKYRLLQLFSNVNEIKCLPYHEFIKMEDFLNYDLLLSTIDLPSEIGQYYKISPVVTKEELMDLVHVMQFRFPLTEKRKIVNDTIDVMMKMPEIRKDQKAMISVQIAKYLKEKHYYQPRKSLKGLKDLLTTDLIAVRASANTGNEAIQLAGELLIKNGFISQKEIDYMISWNEKYPNYTVIDEGVAFPHLLTDVVQEPCISLVSLDHEVEMTIGGGKRFPSLLCWCPTTILLT